MKRLLFTTLLIVSVVASAFAKDPNKISTLALKSFEVEFKDASNVSWAMRTDYTKAEFMMNNKKMEVFYDKNGEKFAYSESIGLDELPVKAKREFARKFEGFTVKEAIYFEGLEESGYYISGENDKSSVVFKISDNGQVSLYEKSKK